MAIDWNREITLGGRSGQAAGAIPTKTTMNLAPRETLSLDIRKVALAALALLLFIGLFAKFGVADVYGQVANRQRELDQQQTMLNSMQSKIADFDAVQEEYQSYAGSDLLGSGAYDSLEVMRLVNRVIEPAATVTAVSSSGQTLSVNVKEVTLDRLGQLSEELKADPMVKDVSVSTANNAAEGQDVSAALIVTLNGLAGADGGAGAGAGGAGDAAAGAAAGGAGAAGDTGGTAAGGASGAAVAM